MIGEKEIERLAELSRLSLTEEEKAVFGKEIADILSYISVISGVDAKAGQETATNVFREDKETNRSGAYTEALLAQAPKSERGYVSVRKIIEQD